MPTTLIRSLKSFKPKHFTFFQSYKAGFDHIINLRPSPCQRLALPQVEQQCTEPGRKEGFSVFNFLLSPPPLPNGNKESARFFILGYKGFLRMEHPLPLKMEDGKGKEFVDEKPKRSGEDVKVQDEEKARLQKEQEKRKEERNRVRELEIEDKIGPPPEKPLAGDCCGQGCEVCIWDTYWEDLDNYKKLRKEAEEASA